MMRNLQMHKPQTLMGITLMFLNISICLIYHLVLPIMHRSTSLLANAGAEGPMQCYK